MDCHELDGSNQRVLWFHEEICHKHGDWTNVEVLFDGTTINQNCDGRWNQRIWAVDGWYYRYSIGKLSLHIKLGWYLPQVPEQLNRARQGEKTKDGPMTDLRDLPTGAKRQAALLGVELHWDRKRVGMLFFGGAEWRWPLRFAFFLSHEVWLQDVSPSEYFELKEVGVFCKMVGTPFYHPFIQSWAPKR